MPTDDWACPNCKTDEYPRYIHRLAVFKCVDCGSMYPVDQVGYSI